MSTSNLSTTGAAVSSSTGSVPPTITQPPPSSPQKSPTSSAFAEGASAGGAIGSVAGALLTVRAVKPALLPWDASHDVIIGGALSAIVTAILKWIRKRRENRRASSGAAVQ